MEHNEFLIKVLDHQGRGITYLDNVVTFVHGALPEEIVNINLVSIGSKYNVANVTKIKCKSPLRVEPLCPYSKYCGGCVLMNMSYKDTITYKKQKIEEIITHYGKFNIKVQVIKNKLPLNYRNKIRFQLVNKKINYFEYNTKKLVGIDNCLVCKEAINKLLGDIKELNLINAEITIRCNYNDELLIVINSKENVDINISNLKKKHKIVGVIKNNQTIYGENFFMEKVGNLYFKVSYDAFFQINSYINMQIFQLLGQHIIKKANVLDLYCGVGSLGQSIAKISNKVWGIEINTNAIQNAFLNAKINKITNTEYFCGSVSEILKKINLNFDSIIIDPPRSGLKKEDINLLIKASPRQIIYISCEPMTLVRDLNLMKDKYEIRNFFIMDMFSYSYHIESLVVLESQDKNAKIS